MVMPKQKPIVDTQKISRNECKHTTIKTKQEESKRRRKEQRTTKQKKTVNKVTIST